MQSRAPRTVVQITLYLQFHGFHISCLHNHFLLISFCFVWNGSLFKESAQRNNAFVRFGLNHGGFYTFFSWCLYFLVPVFCINRVCAVCLLGSNRIMIRELQKGQQWRAEVSAGGSWHSSTDVHQLQTRIIWRAKRFNAGHENVSRTTTMELRKCDNTWACTKHLDIIKYFCHKK